MIRMLATLRDCDIDIMFMCPSRVGDGAYTSFWKDRWLIDSPLAVTFKIIIALDNHILESVREQVALGWGLKNVRRFPRGRVEQSQWDSCMSLMHDLQL